MNKSINIVLISIILAIIFVFLFQTYWVIDTYNITKKRFVNDVNIAISNTMQLYLLSYEEIQFLNKNPKEIYVEHDKIQNENLNFKSMLDKFLKDTSNFEDDEGWVTISINYDDDELQDTTLERTAITDTTLKNFYSNIVSEIYSKMLFMLSEDNYDSKKLDSILSIQLKEKGIYTEYCMEIYNEKTDSISDCLKEYKNGMKISIPIGLSQKNHNVFQVIFPSHFYIIIKKMLLPIVSSLLLIILVVGSLLLMLSIIYRQKRLSVMKEDFINNLTHEFKTPIATVSAAVEALTNFDALSDTNKTNNYLRLSRKELTRLNTMVEKVLRIAEYYKEDLVINKEIILLKPIVDNIIQQQLIKKQKLIEFINNINPDSTVYADKFHLTTIIGNLIDNSVKYSGESVNIEIEYIGDQSFNTLIIKDNGIGISKENLKYIFDKFYRVSKGNVLKVKGFGLGLSYVKYLVSKHDGEINVSSTLGKGSTFKIKLPNK